MTVLGWARPKSPQWLSLCAVVAQVDGAFQTACRGRWPASADGEWHDQKPHGERLCGACERVLAREAE